MVTTHRAVASGMAVIAGGLLATGLASLLERFGVLGAGSPSNLPKIGKDLLHVASVRLERSPSGVG